MVVASPSPVMLRTKKTKAVGIPTIDLSLNRSKLRQLIVEACEEYGFFKVTNHGVPQDIISRLEDEGVGFFAKPMTEKQRAGPANPFGYGCKNIGFNGDMGDLEYLLLHTNPVSINERSKAISDNPFEFSCAVNDYVQAVRELMCEILDLAAEGLGVSDKFVFSRLIRDIQNDSVFRLNNYPSPTPVKQVNDGDSSTKLHHHQCHNINNRIGFGEHSDPQILTILRSNDVGGFQISYDGLWLPVSPDPMQFYVIVGDAFQVLTNGRFKSVRHRAMVNSINKPRMSMVYFGAPPLDAWITSLPETVSSRRPRLYKTFTWNEYKKAVYSLRLGDTRLDLFKIHNTCQITF